MLIEIGSSHVRAHTVYLGHTPFQLLFRNSKSNACTLEIRKNNDVVMQSEHNTIINNSRPQSVLESVVIES
jgi:hypothetical protein